MNPVSAYAEDIKINFRTFIGIGSTIIKNISIGENVVVDVVPVVIDNLPSRAVALGLPAKIIKYREPHNPDFHNNRNS